MNSNSGSVSKHLRTEVNKDHEKEISADDIAYSDSAIPEVAASKNVVDTFVNVFTEDILPEIFDNLEILTRYDLLTFRLVNRYWRDAATSVILKRNLCKIELDFGEVALDEDGNAVGQEGGLVSHPDGTPVIPPTSYSSHKYNSVSRPTFFISDLSQLISTSPKFPCTSFYFRSECTYGFGNLCQPSDLADGDQHQIDLFHFFSLYGKAIRQLSVATPISKKAVQNLLYVHMPHLLCLDIRDLNDFLADDETETDEGDKVPMCGRSTLKLQEIIVGDLSFEPRGDKPNFVKELISVSPNLNAIQDVIMSSLEVLVDVKKCHLVKELHVDAPLPTSPQLKKLLTDTILKINLPSAPSAPRLTISKLSVHLGSDSENTNKQDAKIKGLNLILNASKDSLEYFEYSMIPSHNIVHLFIPPLPHLKYLKFDNYHTSCQTRFYFQGDVIGEAVQAGKLTVDQSAHDFHALTLKYQVDNKIPANYFPRLLKVKLHSQEIRKHSDKLVHFFSMEHLRRDGVTTIPGDSLSTVTTLKVNSFGWDAQNLATLFPNVSYLKIHGGFSKDLHNWVWTAFPKLERFELTGLRGSWNTKIVDSFFTGISTELCAKFKNKATSTQLTGQRTKPYIGDCTNLKEFKIEFNEKLNSRFASKVTAVHGFKDVIQRTKIIFSFQNECLFITSAQEIKETRRYLNPVAAYIEIYV